MRRRRLFIYAALALCLPLPAYAITRGGDGSDGPAALSVSASLAGCGLLETQVVCQLDVSYAAIENATSYTASVTRADGSVADYGEVGAGGTTLWVPYVGAGTYSVQVSAYGEPLRPGGRPKLLGRDSAGTGKGNVDVSIRSGSGRGGEHADRKPSRPGAEGTGDEAPPSCEDETEEPPVEEPPVPGDETSGEDTEGAEEPEAGEMSTPEPASGTLGGVPDATAAALEAEGDLPESVDCPAE